MIEDSLDFLIIPYEDWCDFAVLKGKTLAAIEVSKDKDYMLFETEEGRTYIQFHDQDCCESVEIEDITGDLANLIGSPILLAEVVTNEENPRNEDDDSFTWSFYKLATNRGGVTVRWYGTSNRGAYSETVDFALLRTSL